MKKTRLQFAGILILLLFVVNFAACTDGETDDPVNENPRDKFIGTWVVDESCVRLEYEVNIQADSDSESKVYMDNFAFTGPDYDAAYGFVNGNLINMPQQIIGDNWSVEGTGNYQSDGSILWSYYIEIGANGSNCEADYQ